MDRQYELNNPKRSRSRSPINISEEEEKRLLQTIEEYKAEIDLLSTNLDSCQSLRDNFLKAQQEFIAFNQKCSTDVQKIKFNLKYKIFFL